MKFVNQSQSGMCIWGVPGSRLRVSQECFGPCLQDGPAAPFDFAAPAGRAGEEIADSLLYQDLASQTQIPGRLLSHPAPDCLIGIEVRAAARQVHETQVQARGPQV